VPPAETTNFISKCLQASVEPALQIIALSALSVLLAIDREVKEKEGKLWRADPLVVVVW